MNEIFLLQQKARQTLEKLKIKHEFVARKSNPYFRKVPDRSNEAASEKQLKHRIEFAQKNISMRGKPLEYVINELRKHYKKKTPERKKLILSEEEYSNLVKNTIKKGIDLQRVTQKYNITVKKYLPSVEESQQTVNEKEGMELFVP